MSSPQAPGAASRQAAARPDPAGTSPPSRAAEADSAAHGAEQAPTTVLPGGRSAAGPPADGSTRRPPQRPSAREPKDAVTPRAVTKTRRARLALQRIDPWSVFLYSLVSSVFLGIALVVAVAALYAVLNRLGVPDTVNELFLELTAGDAASEPLLTSGRFVGAATVLAAVNVVLLTLLSTLGALLYNLCASFTGGIEVTLGERD